MALQADKHFSNGAIHMRPALREDIATIVLMLADDPLGCTRESNSRPLPNTYFEAFEAIQSDQNHELMVACLGTQVVGVLQFNILFSLTHRGSKRALIEGVRVLRSYRSRGVGQAMFDWAIKRAREHACSIVQLTTDKTRPDALRFYQSLGFVASHEGMKLTLE